MLETLAVVVLIVLMFVPMLNIVTGAVVGFYLAGWIGAVAGFAVGWIISTMLYDPFHARQR